MKQKPSPLKLTGSSLPEWLAIGHFLLRAPARLGRTELPTFLARLAAHPRKGSNFKQISRRMKRWLRLPFLRSRDTCYLRSLALFRFVDFGEDDLCLHFGVDEPKEANERLHGHAWISLNGKALNPPESFVEGRLKEIYRYSTLTGGSSTSGAAFAAAMLSTGGDFPASGQPSPASPATSRGGAASVIPGAPVVLRKPDL